jgi:hypothetical protein
MIQRVLVTVLVMLSLLLSCDRPDSGSVSDAASFSDNKPVDVTLAAKIMVSTRDDITLQDNTYTVSAKAFYQGQTQTVELAPTGSERSDPPVPLAIKTGDLGITQNARALIPKDWDPNQVVINYTMPLPATSSLRLLGESISELDS